MVFWGDHTGLPKSYKGWNVFVGNGPDNATENQLVASIKKLLGWLKEYMSVDTVTLLLPTTDKQNLFIYATIGLKEEITENIQIPIGKGIAGRIAASNEPTIINDLSKVEVVSPILRQKGLRSLVGVPLPITQGVTGVLHVGTFQSHQFTERDIQQLQLVAHRLRLKIADVELSKLQKLHNLAGYRFNLQKTAELKTNLIMSLCWNSLSLSF
ncbi:GAF domain-containing protein [Komarekiella sp. 'clone 1']|uniref:GAF domain-containing protein n=1 Tax=Komarekiella delphini-convector SJRDD-AB1 TaxID=2593771 RepID=A0AA40T2F4_9NOST|nr:GAF domain-containing protein [Komarekiella delphini-convector]MBD6619673.1 GAF domain-containing protein [Komarekiella delphini-convector SJRDD-AB1]